MDMIHPFEIALSGYSGSGKTTLATRLLEHWRGAYDVGYVKHNAHVFQMDTPGKDTARATEAGARVVCINSPDRIARLGHASFSLFERRKACPDSDFVLVEGMKDSPLPKLVLLDASGRAASDLAAGRFQHVMGVVSLFAGAEPPPGVDLPFFPSDATAEIAAFLEQLLLERARTPLYGLVLAGGQSRRMGTPKWAISYHDGQTELERMTALLGEVTEQVFISVRPGQDVPMPPSATAVPDAFPPWGPITGILSAMEAHPGAAWLVAACDLPLLGSATMHHLAQHRAVFKIATVFRSAQGGRHRGLPEPLCAIWEPRARHRILEAAGLGLTCPRKILIESRPALLDLPNPQALDNINTPEEHADALRRVRA